MQFSEYHKIHTINKYKPMWTIMKKIHIIRTVIAYKRYISNFGVKFIMSFVQWLSNFDRKCKVEGYYFFVNASSHPRLNLQIVKLIFFPPNVALTCQTFFLQILKKNLNSLTHLSIKIHNFIYRYQKYRITKRNGYWYS